MTRVTIRFERGGRVDEVDLDSLVTGERAERAASDAIGWIKSLRHARIDGQTFRDRFTYRGDSLWWFAELFLHREGQVDRWHRAVLALEALCTEERPDAIGLDTPDRVLTQLLPQAAARHGCRVSSLPPAARVPHDQVATAVKGRFYTWSALASRWLSRGVPAIEPGGALAFVHAAFWRRPASGAAAASTVLDGEEGYIGPVLDALARDRRAQPLRLVGVGPAKNFRARRWWHALSPTARADRAALPVTPVELFATRAALDGSTAMWRARVDHARALVGSDDLRARATVYGYDVWPLLFAELRGIAELQFPWSARAMDEAAAALDACRPRLVVTYAEAGGWGRALVLEARRRGIPSAGVQHGFIYRHWLNYRHEPDEAAPSPANDADRGFPRPDLTVVFDGYAEAHLQRAGGFPATSLEVTGSPALDRLSATLSAITAADRDTARRALDVDAAHVALVVSKYSQIARELPALIAAAEAAPNLRLVIKPHPAETAAPYEAAARGTAHVRIAPAHLDLARLLAVARTVVTVHSTVAIDAMVLGLPALVVGLPTNLSPFVEAGAMAGAATGDEAAALLIRLCVDEPYRANLLASARRFADDWRIASDGLAAARAAEAILRLANPQPHAPMPASPQAPL
jgi:hypothetical protein